MQHDVKRRNVNKSEFLNTLRVVGFEFKVFKNDWGIDLIKFYSTQPTE